MSWVGISFLPKWLGEETIPAQAAPLKETVNERGTRDEQRRSDKPTERT